MNDCYLDTAQVSDTAYWAHGIYNGSRFLAEVRLDPRTQLFTLILRDGHTVTIGSAYAVQLRITHLYGFDVDLWDVFS